MRNLVPVVLTLALTPCIATDADRVRIFEREVEVLRQTLRILGMSAVIEGPEGSLDARIRRPREPCGLASVTKTLYAGLQLVEKGRSRSMNVQNMAARSRR
jgi:hypothetical protein